MRCPARGRARHQPGSEQRSERREQVRAQVHGHELRALWSIQLLGKITLRSDIRDHSGCPVLREHRGILLGSELANIRDTNRLGFRLFGPNPLRSRIEIVARTSRRWLKLLRLFWKLADVDKSVFISQRLQIIPVSETALPQMLRPPFEDHDRSDLLDPADIRQVA